MSAYSCFVGLQEALDVLAAAEELLEARMLEFENVPEQDEVHQQLYVAALSRAREIARALDAMTAVMQPDSPVLKISRTQLQTVS